MKRRNHIQSNSKSALDANGLLTVAENVKNVSHVKSLRAYAYNSDDINIICMSHLADWKRHKVECKSGAAKQQADKMALQNKTKSSLSFGQSQQVITIARFLHHFAAISEEMLNSDSQMAQAVQAFVTGKFAGRELGTVQLGLKEVMLVWNAIWAMTEEERDQMVRKFLAAMENFQFPDGFDYTVVTDWAKHFRYGDFAAVKHTSEGTILLYEDKETDDITAYLCVGISQPIESLLSQANQPLPMFINTGIFPFKNMVLCQGTIIPALGEVSNRLKATAEAYVKGDVSELTTVTSML